MQEHKLHNRVWYLDTAKAYLIMAVVMGHILIVLNPYYDILWLSAIQSFINTFHMPAFFIINGVLFNYEKWAGKPICEFVKARFRALVIPYIFFEAIGIVCRRILWDQDIVDGVVNAITVRCNVGADWFLIALFIGSIMFFIYARFGKKYYGVFLIIACLVTPVFMRGSQLATVIGRSMLACGFITVGYLMKNVFLWSRNKSALHIIISTMVTVAIAVMSLKFGGNDFYSCSVHNPVNLLAGGGKRNDNGAWHLAAF